MFHFFEGWNIFFEETIQCHALGNERQHGCHSLRNERRHGILNSHFLDPKTKCASFAFYAFNEYFRTIFLSKFLA